MRIRIIVAVALVAVGLVWLGQGLGLLQGSSFMVGDATWAAIGAVLVVAGVVVGLSARRRPRA
ncbi:MAG: hypothetical protein WEG56_05440 [Chloroflexota bacterium]